MHCPATPDIWQVGVDFNFPPAPNNPGVKGTYFLVRWRPPYRFSMVQITDHPSPTCAEEDPEADESRTLFPIEEWR